MWKSLQTGLLITCLLFAGNLSVHTAAKAEETPIDETDLEFSKRMTKRVEQVLQQTEQLDEVVERNKFRLQNDGGRSPMTSTHDDQIRQAQDSARTGTFGDPYRNMKRRLSSLRNKAEKERKRLQAPLGSESSAKKLDRKSVEKNVKRVERDFKELQQDLYEY